METVTPFKADLDHIVISVADIQRAVTFYRDVVGFKIGRSDEAFRFAQFDFGSVSLRLVGESEADKNLGRARNFAVGFAVADVQAAHDDWVSRGVNFQMPPTRQPWGAVMARFADPEGNILYLVQE